MASDPPGESAELPDDLARLPPGRHGLPPEFVERNQRQRLIASLIRVVAERGYNATTITAIIEGASITSATFYKYSTTSRTAIRRLRLRGRHTRRAPCGGLPSEDEWPLQVRAALAAALEFFAASPSLGRLCLTEPFAAGPTISRHYQGALERLVPFLREGRQLHPASEALPATTERGLLGSIAAQVGRKLPAAEEGALEALLPDLTQFALTPYLGASEARRVALLDR